MKRHKTEDHEIVKHTQARSTGSTIILQLRDNSWTLMCLNHSQIKLFTSRKSARNAAAAPETWCSDCTHRHNTHAPKYVNKIN